MTANGYLQLALYLVVLLAIAKPLGAYMAREYENQPVFVGRILGPVEQILYRLAGVRPDVEMAWKSYALAMLPFNMLGLFAVCLLQRVQGSLPLNPESLGAVAAPGIQHGGQFRVQHQPVIVWGRDDPELPHADARPDGAANGSLIMKDGKPVGSALIGQAFDDPKYFWSRPSATGPFPYNAGASSGSNLGPTNPDLLKAVADHADALKKADPGNTKPVPVDLVTASGSGLDLHVTPASALYQASRVARARGLDEPSVQTFVERHVEGRQFGLLGEQRVNVLRLNLALDAQR